MHVRKVPVKHSHIRQMFAVAIDGLPATRRFGHNTHVSFNAQSRPKPHPSEKMIVNNQNSNGGLS
jgi:hypothetical protein